MDTADGPSGQGRRPVCLCIFYARRENAHHQRCVSFWNLTAPAVWSRAWWTSSHSPTPTVRSNYIEHICNECRSNTNYSVTVSYASEVENIGCSVACTNAGWCQCTLCRWVAIVQHGTEICLSKVMYKVQGKVPELSTRGETWTRWVVGINAGVGRQQLQVNFNKFVGTYFLREIFTHTIIQDCWSCHEEKVCRLHLEAAGCFLDSHAGEVPHTSHVRSPHGRQGKAWRQFCWQGERQFRHQGHPPAPGEIWWKGGGGGGKQWQWSFGIKWPWTNLQCDPVSRTTLKIGTVLYCLFEVVNILFFSGQFTCFLPVCTVSIPLLGRLVAIRTASKTPTCLDFCFTPLRSKCQENYTSYPNGAAYKSILSETFLAKPVQWNSRPPEQKYYRSWQGTSIVRQLGVMKAWPMISWRPWTNIEGSRSPMSRGCSMSYALWICF